MSCHIILRHIMLHHLVAHDVPDHTRHHIALQHSSCHVPDHTSHSMCLHNWHSFVTKLTSLELQLPLSTDHSKWECGWQLTLCTDHERLQTVLQVQA